MRILLDLIHCPFSHSVLTVLEASSKLEDLVSTERAWEVDLIGAPGTLIGPNTLIDLVESMTGKGFLTIGL